MSVYKFSWTDPETIDCDASSVTLVVTCNPERNWMKRLESEADTNRVRVKCQIKTQLKREAPNLGEEQQLRLGPSSKSTYDQEELDFRSPESLVLYPGQ